jgi:CMP-N-acetylneuraminic acid synthetase
MSGCEVPFMRPPELARDDTPHLPVMQHAVQWLAEREGYRPDAVMILQPTSPLRRPIDIADAIRLLERTGADSVVSVSSVPAHFNPMRMLRADESGNAALFLSGEPVRRRINRRQDMPTAWTLNGAVYLFRTEVLTAAEPSLYGDRVVIYPMPDVQGTSIDDMDDWKTAERALGQDSRNPRT